MMLGSLPMSSMASCSLRALSPRPSLRKDGLRRSMRDTGSPPERRRISSAVRGCLTSSRSVNSTPSCESAAFALRQVVQVDFQYNVTFFTMAFAYSPSGSSTSSIDMEIPLKIGVSRTVYKLDSVSRRSITRSRKSLGSSDSKDTTKS